MIAIIQRKTVDDIITEREENVGNVSETNVGNVSETQRTIERDLATLQKANIIRHEGKVNDGIWVVLEKNVSCS